MWKMPQGFFLLKMRGFFLRMRYFKPFKDIFREFEAFLM
jgi:hypothetical protein